MDLDGRHVFSVCAGSGEPLLLLHGFPQSASCWRHQIPALAESHHVVAPDWPGFGRSEPPSTPATYDNEIERIDRFVQQLGWQRFNLFAHDYGGFIGLAHRKADRRFGNSSRTTRCPLSRGCRSNLATSAAPPR